MRLYINHLNITQLPAISKTFHPYLHQSGQHTIVYTTQGIYRVKEHALVQLEPVDKDIVVLTDYHTPFTLIADKSYFRETNVESLHGDTHCAIRIDQLRYKLSKHGRVELVIEYEQQLSDKKPHDLYFRVADDIDPNDLFIKQELIEFLSMLN